MNSLAQADNPSESPHPVTSPAHREAVPQPKRLPLPESVRGAKILWPFVIPLASIHLLALLAAVPWFFSWTGLILLIVGVPLTGILGMNLCYHRLLSHRSLVVPDWFERVLVLIAVCCLEGPPGKWIAMHRYHHRYSDQQPDPHTPLVNFLWAHVGWLVYRNPDLTNINMYQRYARDILSVPFYMKLEKSLTWVWVYLAHALMIFMIGVVAGAVIGGTWITALQMGLSLLVWGVILRTVLVWHITWSVNSLTHIWGYRRYETNENSRNNWLVGVLAGGEGWHNNHHEDPTAASNQRSWWELDVTYYTIKLLEWVGLAKNVVPRRDVRRSRTLGKV